MKNFLTHTALVKIFKGGFCHSLNNRAEFEKGIDDYVLPSIMNDVQVRVLTVKQGSIGIDEIKAELCDFIKKAFWSYFYAQGELIDFPSWHDNACRKVIEILEKRYDGVTYGKAQKIVNMIFKYLYCFDGALNFEDCFGECHMPLDSKILDWYRRNVDKEQKTPWSKLEKKEYLEIQEKIDEHVKKAYNNSYTTLEAEFIIWDSEINKRS